MSLYHLCNPPAPITPSSLNGYPLLQCILYRFSKHPCNPLPSLLHHRPRQGGVGAVLHLATAAAAVTRALCYSLYSSSCSSCYSRAGRALLRHAPPGRHARSPGAAAATAARRLLLLLICSSCCYSSSYSRCQRRDGSASGRHGRGRGCCEWRRRRRRSASGPVGRCGQCGGAGEGGGQQYAAGAHRGGGEAARAGGRKRECGVRGGGGGTRG